MRKSIMALGLCIAIKRKKENQGMTLVKTMVFTTRVLPWFYQIIKGTMHMTSGLTKSATSCLSLKYVHED